MSRVIFGISPTFLGADIKSLRAKLGLSQDRLARELGCSTAAVQQWEQNRRRPGQSAIERMRQLAPDEETRQAFGLESGISNLEPPSHAGAPGGNARSDLDLPSPGPSPLTRKQRRDLHEEMCTAIGLICERAPDQIVSDLARRIRRRAGTYTAKK